MSSQKHQHNTSAHVRLPPALTESPVQRLVQPLARFLEIEAASGVLLVICTVTALALANSPWSHGWEEFWHMSVVIRIGSWELSNTLLHWINDGLMTIFFFLVGLEIKREIVDGELRSFKKAALPLVAAVGGMLVPATVFLLSQGGGEGQRGWGIPMATDIAFAVGILALLGRRVPAGLKIFLLALAIADDIGAILIIAIFYSGALEALALLAAALGVLFILMMHRLGVRSVAAYWMVGVGIWLAMYQSGIHPTVAGVVLGLVTPSRAWIARQSLVDLMLDAIDRLDGQVDRPAVVGALTRTARETISPLERLEASLHGWVAFAIMPIFALANAGVQLQPAAAGNRVAWAVAAGLALGKPLGIFACAWLAVRCGIAQLPSGASWRSLFGVGCLGGIGFTMSLFIASLALEGTLLDAAKIGTLVGSTISAVVGYGLLYAVLPRTGELASTASSLDG